MGTFGVRASAALAVLSVVGLSVVSVSAEASTRPGFGPVHVISGPTANGVYGPTVVSNPSGDMLVTWADRRTGRVQVAERVPGHGWRRPVTLSAAHLYGDWYPSVAVDVRGDAVVAWSAYDGSRDRIQVASRPAHGTWSRPVTMARVLQRPFGPQVALDARGDATITWNKSTSTDLSVMVARRPAGRSWGTPRTLSAPGSVTDDPQVGMDTEGNTFVVWSQQVTSTQWKMMAVRRKAGGSWTSPKTLSASGQDAGLPRIAVNPRGDAVVSWESCPDPQACTVAAARRPAGGAWSKPTVLTEPGDSALFPLVAISATGDAIVAWDNIVNTDTGTNTQGIDVARWSATRGWRPRVSVSFGGTNPDVAMDAHGDAVVSYEIDDEFGQDITCTVQRPHGGSWSTKGITRLSPFGTVAFSAALAMDARGDTVGVYQAGYEGDHVAARIRPAR